jgi:hypothetical protein
MEGTIFCDKWGCCAASVIYPLRGRITADEEEQNFTQKNCQQEGFEKCPHYHIPRGNLETSDNLAAFLQKRKK